MIEDRETMEVLEHGKRVQELVSSELWKLAKDELFKIVSEISTIEKIPNIESMNDEALAKEIRIRNGSISIVMQWIRQLEGTANQYQNNKRAIEKVNLDEIVRTF